MSEDNEPGYQTVEEWSKKVKKHGLGTRTMSPTSKAGSKPKEKKEKKERKVKVSVEKPKPAEATSASQLTKQTQEITRLLSVWNDCPTSVIEKFVEAKFDVSLTRRCLQEAKDHLGLHQPEYSENTIHKKTFAEYVMYQLASQFGVAGLTEEQFAGKIGRALNEKFEERTHTRMVRDWVHEFMQLLKPYALHPARIVELLAIAKEKVSSTGLLTKATGQHELL